MASPRPQSIPVFLLVRNAFQLLKQQRDDALRLGLVPVLMCFGGILFGQRDMQLLMDFTSANAPDQITNSMIGAVLLMTVIVLLAYCIIAVNWLRFVLLGPMASVGLGLTIGRPHGAYLVAVIALLFVGGIAMSVATMPASLLSGFLAQLASLGILIIVGVTIARFVPFLVALAVGQPMTLRQAWLASRGNGVPILTALVLSYAPFLVAAVVVSALLHAIGFAAVAPIATMFITALFQVAAWIVQAGVLATAYRHLVGIKV
jgi:hypothetical protein